MSTYGEAMQRWWFVWQEYLRLLERQERERQQLLQSVNDTWSEAQGLAPFQFSQSEVASRQASNQDTRSNSGV